MRVRRSKEDLLRTVVQTLRVAPHRKLSYAELKVKTGLPKSSLSYVLREMVDQRMILGFIENRQKCLTPVYKLITEVHWVRNRDKVKDKRVAYVVVHEDKSVEDLGLYLPVRVRGPVRTGLDGKVKERVAMRRVGDSKVKLTS